MFGRVGDSKSDPHDCYEELCHQTTQPSKVLWLTLEITDSGAPAAEQCCSTGFAGDDKTEATWRKNHFSVKLALHCLPQGSCFSTLFLCPPMEDT